MNLFNQKAWILCSLLFLWISSFSFMLFITKYLTIISEYRCAFPCFFVCWQLYRYGTFITVSWKTNTNCALLCKDIRPVHFSSVPWLLDHQMGLRTEGRSPPPTCVSVCGLCQQFWHGHVMSLIHVVEVLLLLLSSALSLDCTVCDGLGWTGITINVVSCLTVNVSRMHLLWSGLPIPLSVFLSLFLSLSFCLSLSLPLSQSLSFP